MPRKSSSPPRRETRGRPVRHVWVRLILILVIALLLVYILPTPWALEIGGRFNIGEQWDGYGPVQASNGGHYLLFTHLRGGITNGDDTQCSLTGCNSLTGSAQLCTRSGQHYTFSLSGAVHSWLSTDGALTTINLTGGTPQALPRGWVVAFHGIWQGAVLPVANTDHSFTEAFTPAGAIRTATSSADAGTAHGELRFGSAASFDRACRTLAHGPG